MKRNILTFGDIVERNVFFYDEKVKDICIEFCKILALDYLPSLDGRHKFELRGNVFLCTEIEDWLWVDDEDPVFHPDAFKRFKPKDKNSGPEGKEQNILFVRQHGTFVGVVHISDYNRTPVMKVLQDWVTEFEYLLRRYLFELGKTDSDIIEKFIIETPKDEKRKKDLDKKIKKGTRLHPFQIFYLRELMLYVKGFAPPLSLSDQEVEDINRLRNIAMHGNDVVQNDGLIYDVATLSTLFNRVNTLERKLNDLHSCLFELEKPLRALLNQKKLEILNESDFNALGFLRTYYSFT
jgi:hypothetical protein